MAEADLVSIRRASGTSCWGRRRTNCGVPSRTPVLALVHLALLAAVSAAVSLWTLIDGSVGVGAAIVTITSVALLPVTYNNAVRNVGEWRLAIRALVNTGRLPVAKAVGLRLPATFQEERDLWDAYIGLVAYGPRHVFLRTLNRHRASEPLDDRDGPTIRTAPVAR
jgi:hypothetical protein